MDAVEASATSGRGGSLCKQRKVIKQISLGGLRLRSGAPVVSEAPNKHDNRWEMEPKLSGTRADGAKRASETRRKHVL